MWWLIASVLLMQYPSDDRGFVQVETEWLWSVSSASTLDAFVSPKQARLIRMLGCDHFACRETAWEDLSVLGDSAIPALTLGLRHRDPEVRARCERGLVALGWCANCRGHGYCRRVYPDDGEQRNCEVCNAQLWFYKPKMVVLDENGVPVKEYVMIPIPGRHSCKYCDGFGWRRKSAPYIESLEELRP